MRDLVSATSPATSCGDKSHCANWSLLLQNLIAGTSLNFWDKSLQHVSQNALCELFVGPAPETSPFV